jgi:pimeloyl-ACP methyl ester carboxylesterase
MRIRTSTNPWCDSPKHAGLVNIKTHALWASVSGPIRKDKDPLLIFFTGAGGASAIHVKLQQQLSPFIRCLFYDRAGYDRSTLPALDEKKDRILASDTARDLTKLLAVTGLQPPYILVAHSFGGIIARTFLQLHVSNPEVVRAMLLFDTATELMLALFPRLPPLELVSIARNVDVEALTHLQRDSGMTDEEWEYAIAASERCRHAQSLEDTHASAYALALHRQLDHGVFHPRPLTVVQCNMTRDYQMLYDEGVKLGDGSEEERAVARGFIEKWGCFHGQLARAQTRLSGHVRMKYFERWGHDLPMRRPQIVVDEVRGLLERMEGQDWEDGVRVDTGRNEASTNNDVSGTIGVEGGKENVEKRREKVFLSPAMSFLG